MVTSKENVKESGERPQPTGLKGIIDPNAKRSGKEILAAEVAKKAASKVFKNKDAFISKDAFREALAKAFEETGKVPKDKCREFADKVEVGLALWGAKDPLKQPMQGLTMELDVLREKLMEVAIESFYPIFGEKKARDKAREFVVLLLGEPGFKKSKDKKKSLLEQITDQIQALMVVTKGKMNPDLAQDLIKNTIIKSISDSAQCDLDAFILNEALNAPGKKLLTTMHDAMIAKAAGGGEKGFSMPLQI